MEISSVEELPHLLEQVRIGWPYNKSQTDCATSIPPRARIAARADHRWTIRAMPVSDTDGSCKSTRGNETGTGTIQVFCSPRLHRSNLPVGCEYSPAYKQKVWQRLHNNRRRAVRSVGMKHLASHTVVYQHSHSHSIKWKLIKNHLSSSWLGIGGKR